MAACIVNSRNHGAAAAAHCLHSYKLLTNYSLCKLTRGCIQSDATQSLRVREPNAESLREPNADCMETKINSSSISRHTLEVGVSKDQIWLKIREEALFDIDQEPILSQYYHTTILSRDSLESALANHLAVKICTSSLSSDVLYEVFVQALVEEDRYGNGLRDAIRDDLKAWKERDPACASYVHCFLNFKGFLACQAQRIAHKFWVKGRTVLAVLVQNRVSEVFGVDIHPGARIGRGIVIDHATGVVIGETSEIGDNVTILHNVTLGGTGKFVGDRHPKIGDGVLIGAGAKLLGNIKVGEGAKIGAASVVLKEVPPGATVVGNPARLVRAKNIL